MSVDCWRRSPKDWPEELRDRQCDKEAHVSWTHCFTTENGSYCWRDKPTATVINEKDQCSCGGHGFNHLKSDTHEPINN